MNSDDRINNYISEDHFSMAKENNSENYIDISYDDAERLEDYSHACHCMIYAALQEKVFGIYSPRAAILMQMRFDGFLGFPGGLTDPGESWEDGLIREIQEELGFTNNELSVMKEDHVFSQRSISQKLCFHFFAREITYEKFVDLEAETLKSSDYGNEVLGVVRVPLFTMSDGYRGFPVFLGHKFAGNSRHQLLYTLKHLQIMSEQEINTALDVCQKNLNR